MNWTSRLPTALLGLCLALPMLAHAASESDLLPVDEAFQLSTRALNRDEIEVAFKIAPSYYLYRERMKVESADPAGFSIVEAQWPNGDPKEDEFFGHVETYRLNAAGTVIGQAAPTLAEVSLKISYQGCADIGICYPPQRRTVTVALPAQAPANPAGFLPGTSPGLGDTSIATAGGASSNPLAGLGQTTSVLGATDALPLPEDQAFQFEAIAESSTEFLLRFTMPPNYYLYRDHSRFELVDPNVGTLGSPLWPAAQTIQDPEFGAVQVYFDLVEVPLRLARRDGAPTVVALKGFYQGCIKDGICYPPMERTLQVEFPAASAGELTKVAELIADEAAPAKAPTATSIQTPEPNAGSLPALTFWQALLAALLGGLVLNLMPCVLPVLSLKAISLASSGETPAKARAHALWYTAGVLSSFAVVGLLVIALRSGGAALGWGFQLQQPIFVGLMAYVMLALGLSLSGLILIGAGLANIGSNLADQSGAKGDFFTGVLAVVVASPCTAPFMGGALSFAFNQSPLVALIVFLALGLGLALPFLLVGFVPALAHRLPKPGAWMDTLKQWLAYPLYITAVWLAWVLGHQRGVDAMAIWLIGALALTAGLWWWEKNRFADRQWSRHLLAALLVAASLWALWTIHRLPADAPAQNTSQFAKPYSAELLTQLRGAQTPVFVNMTADWCVSCKVNERSTLSGDRFKQALADTGTVYLKGDWTNEDPTITAFLKEHGAVGVPLYVFYAKGSSDGVVLPAILTPDLVDRTIRGEP
ncbi:cytochrome C biogenesis protein [Ahniella affigens]|uniref:Cytochrome C biogenesis protein n=1 Tax=Ahniella affigens TaxID=2021234 RepID=A0A2P1PQ52_9GAMM|nr:protein-disulfide reductase DsbD [Ahniella affigens]AVP96965.1 cytochrome C biogenesis protein [Ahniella affigens]